jgi:MEKHLA domain
MVQGSAEPPWKQPTVIRHSQRLLRSFQHWTGRSLMLDQPLENSAQALYEAPFVLVSHGTEADPIFNYGNRQALELWELDWQTFTRLPSRRSVAPTEHEDRERLLQEAKAKGYISNYRGIRISSTGRQFWIENVILWDVLDEQQQPCGQAATFDRWRFIEGNFSKP